MASLKCAHISERCRARARARALTDCEQTRNRSLDAVANCLRKLKFTNAHQWIRCAVPGGLRCGYWIMMDGWLCIKVMRCRSLTSVSFMQKKNRQSNVSSRWIVRCHLVELEFCNCLRHWKMGAKQRAHINEQLPTNWRCNMRSRTHRRTLFTHRKEYLGFLKSFFFVVCRIVSIPFLF